MVRKDDLVRLGLVPAQARPDRGHGGGARRTMGRDQRVPPGGVGHHDRRIRSPGVARENARKDRRGKGGDPSPGHPARYRTASAGRPRRRPAARPAARVRRLGTRPDLRLEGASGRDDRGDAPRPRSRSVAGGDDRRVPARQRRRCAGRLVAPRVRQGDRSRRLRRGGSEGAPGLAMARPMVPAPAPEERRGVGRRGAQPGGGVRAGAGDLGDSPLGRGEAAGRPVEHALRQGRPGVPAEPWTTPRRDRDVSALAPARGGKGALAEACAKQGIACRLAGDFPEGWRIARRWAGKGGVVLVCGSLAAAGDAYRHRVGFVA